MPGRPDAALNSQTRSLFAARDELSFRNLRGNLWPFLLVFPISVIAGNLRFFDHSIALTGFESHIVTFFLLGLGWLVISLVQKKMIIPILQVSAAVNAVLNLALLFLPWGLLRDTLQTICIFFNGLSVACSFYIFCFVLKNIERLFGMLLIQFFYSFYYVSWIMFPSIHTASNTWAGFAATAVLFIIVIFCRSKQEIDNESEGKGSGVPFILVLAVIQYTIMLVTNYVEWAESGISILAFGIGTFAAIGIVIIIQLFKGLNALYIWLMFLVFSLLGLGLLIYDIPVTFISGSLIYGLGDSLGYIIISYICATAIQKSKSHRMFRLYCLVCFGEYFIISGIFSLYFSYFDTSNRLLAFGVVLAFVSICLLFLPLIQKKLFEADWTDGLYLRDIEEYSVSFAETEKINIHESLNLTDREGEVFTMLLNGSSPKAIAYTLKISYNTVIFHQKNLYRKLGIQSRAELFARYYSERKEPT